MHIHCPCSTGILRYGDENNNMPDTLTEASHPWIFQTIFWARYSSRQSRPSLIESRLCKTSTAIAVANVGYPRERYIWGRQEDSEGSTNVMHASHLCTSTHWPLFPLSTKIEERVGDVLPTSSCAIHIWVKLSPLVAQERWALLKFDHPGMFKHLRSLIAAQVALQRLFCVSPAHYPVVVGAPLR